MLTEDLDTVTLAENKDLHDVLKQRLNPARINVQLNSNERGASQVRPSGSSMPIKSSKVHDAVPNLQKFHCLCINIALKTASSPIVSELLDSFTKMEKFYFTQEEASQKLKKPLTQISAEASQDQGTEPASNISKVK
ncbi:hypothetical protein Nepgr_025276 [Nepenthes gracilis]|uniref:Uncharacterized protein n=1 Tax=Nepenthes gracilis TaxID=150966 RepID=A0AAD3T4F7_NEPGR|nr:hypothetical protein Nepgr_025276 [Nepenthes gracilis]